MKRFVIFVFILFFSVSVFALESPWEKKLPFKSATIYYAVNGSMKGNKTLYVKDYGKTRAEYIDTAMTMLGMTQKQKQITITTPDWVFEIDMVNMTGKKHANPKKFLNREFHKLSKSKQRKVIKNAKKMAYDFTKKTSGNLKLNAAKILGYKCDIAEVMGVKTYSISGTDIPLKTIGNVMGMKISEIATKIVKGRIPASKFKAPKGIHINHEKMADQMAEMQAKNVIQMLLDGKATAHSSNSNSNYSGGHNGANAGNSQQLTPEQQKQMQQMMQMFGGQAGQ